MFWLNEEYAAGLAREIVLDGVVCVVDAVFGKKVQHQFMAFGPSSPSCTLANGRRPFRRRHW
jgi:hypothetical protein